MSTKKAAARKSASRKPASRKSAAHKPATRKAAPRKAAPKGFGSAPRARQRRLPGDPDLAALMARMLRVDHAGEYGARQIYRGQLAVLADHAWGETIAHMAGQEEEHLARFSRLLQEHGVRPTLLQPLWHIAGFGLGFGSALLSPRAAMAVTVAVEEVIIDHYNAQIRTLDGRLPEFAKTLQVFRDEEDEHRETGLGHEAESLIYYRLLRALVRGGCKGAIWLSERV